MDCFATAQTAHPFGVKIEHLMHRMVSPLMGLDKTIGFSLHDRGSAGVFVSVVQLTAVHRLLGWPKPLSYHLGGYGLRREEAMIRALGETTERYAHMTALVGNGYRRRFASARQLRMEGHDVMELEGWNFFPEAVYSHPKLTFARFDPDAPFTWLEVWDLINNKPAWVPAQLLVLGYRCRKQDGEPWISPAFTTGTAAHTVPERALNSGMLELLQMDAAMGCWYSGATAPEIELDDSIGHLATILSGARGSAYEVCFHRVPSPDFDVHVVACVLRARRGVMPAVAVGIACDTQLESACYKAFLEASAIPHLSQMGFMGEPAVLRRQRAIDSTSISDLDANVLFYSLPEHTAAVDRHFRRHIRIPASHLPRYPKRSDRELTRHLLDRFKENGVRLYAMELSTPDITDLGFHVCRTYSPDLLSLSLPSYPQAGHPRYRAYGGVNVSDPHPYP